MRASLQEVAVGRLGRVDYALLAPRFFRAALADDLAASAEFTEHFDRVCPIILLNGGATHAERRTRADRVSLLGVDDRFWAMNPSPSPSQGEGRGEGPSPSPSPEEGRGGGSWMPSGRVVILNEPWRRNSASPSATMCFYERASPARLRPKRCSAGAMIQSLRSVSLSRPSSPRKAWARSASVLGRPRRKTPIFHSQHCGAPCNNPTASTPFSSRPSATKRRSNGNCTSILERTRSSWTRAGARRGFASWRCCKAACCRVSFWWPGRSLFGFSLRSPAKGFSL